MRISGGVSPVEKKAWNSIRKNSKFFINLAGVIGEKFLEISPGSLDASELASGDNVRGEDPPRIDQLISQSYGLAGKLIEMVNKNEGSISSAALMGTLRGLVGAALMRPAPRPSEHLEGSRPGGRREGPVEQPQILLAQVDLTSGGIFQNMRRRASAWDGVDAGVA